MTKLFFSLALFSLVNSPVLSQKNTTRPDQKYLFDAEVAFSNASAENGFHNANLAYAAEDALVFRPYKINAREWSNKLKGPEDSTYRLTWYPSLIDVSAAGDLGYGTGPFDNVSTIPGDNTVFNRGQFVTVWKKQLDGSMKFIMDFGSGALPENEFVSKEPIYAPKVSPVMMYKKADAVDLLKKIFAVEEEYSKECQTAGDLNALEKFADNDIRFFYQKEFYARGLEMARKRIIDKNGKHLWKPMDGTVAESNDLAHVYGTHQYKEGDAVKEGYYMRLWKRQSNGAWKIVVQVRSLVPALPK